MKRGHEDNFKMLQFDELQLNPFERKRQIKLPDEEFTIPDQKTFFGQQLWTDDHLQQMKESLNAVKSKINHLNPKKWHDLTRSVSMCGDVKFAIKKNFSPECLSRAWIKMYEMLAMFDVIPYENLSDDSQRFSSVHLCEAPGAFIAALNHYLANKCPGKNWDWLATTLNPYYEGNNVHFMINEDVLIKHTIDHWTFLSDNTGNIMDIKNIDFLAQKASKQLSEILLVTADGSVDCQSNPAEQEITVSRLHFTEIVAALSVLQKGGSFVVKIFTTFECQTICNIYLLMSTFKEVVLLKPATSGDGNSEIYLVCREYYGIDPIKTKLDTMKSFVEDETTYGTMALFKRSDIPKHIMARIYEATKFFTAQQIRVIERNIQLFDIQRNVNQFLGPSKAAATDKWIKLTKIEKLRNKRKLIPVPKKNDVKRCYVSVSAARDETRSYHQKQQDLHETNIVKILRRVNADIKRLKNHKYIWDNFTTPINAIQEPKVGEKEKVYVNINNSRYCIADLIIVRNELRSKFSDPAYTNLGDSITNDHCSCSINSVNRLAKSALKNDDIKNKNSLDIEVMCYHETLSNLLSKLDILATADGLETLVNKIKHLQADKSLFLCEFSLLSRLHVGYMLILSSFFTTVKLCINQELALSGLLFVNFLGAEGKEKIFDILERIIVDLKCEEHVPLTVAPFNALDEGRYDRIVRYNSSNLYHSLSTMIKKAKAILNK